MLGSVYYCCGKIPGQIDGRSGKNTSGCIEGFWRLAIENNPRIFRRKTAGLLTQKPARPQSDVFFSREPIKISVIYNASTSNFVIMISIDKGIHLLYIKHTFFLVWYPSGKGLVCKTIIGRFDSYPHLLWRVPAIPQDAEGLGKLSAYFCKKFLISQA